MSKKTSPTVAPSLDIIDWILSASSLSSSSLFITKLSDIFYVMSISKAADFLIFYFLFTGQFQRL